MSVFFSVAEEFLSYAFDHCHRSSQKNKRMILIYLLPVKMLLVRNSTQHMLNQFMSQLQLILV